MDTIFHAIHFEIQELKKLGPWKSQLELQKKQIAEVQVTLDEERRRADKFELQFKNLLERNEALTLEKEVLVINYLLTGLFIYQLNAWLTAFARRA